MFSSLLRRGCMTALVTARTAQRTNPSRPSTPHRTLLPRVVFAYASHRRATVLTFAFPRSVNFSLQDSSLTLYSSHSRPHLAHFFFLHPARKMRRSPILAVTLLHHFRKLHFLVSCSHVDPCSPRFVPPLCCFPTSLPALHVCVVLCCSLMLLLCPAPQHCSSVLMLSL